MYCLAHVPCLRIILLPLEFRPYRGYKDALNSNIVGLYSIIITVLDEGCSPDIVIAELAEMCGQLYPVLLHDCTVQPESWMHSYDLPRRLTSKQQA
jgi:hypothetical protein